MACLEDREPFNMYVTKNDYKLLHIEQDEIFIGVDCFLIGDNDNDDNENLESDDNENSVNYEMVNFESRVEIKNAKFYKICKIFYSNNTYIWIDITDTHIIFCAWENRKLGHDIKFMIKHSNKIWINKRCSGIFIARNLLIIAADTIKFDSDMINIYLKNDLMSVSVNVGNLGEINFFISPHIVKLESANSLFEQCYYKLSLMHSKEELDAIIKKTFSEPPEQLIKITNLQCR